MAAGEHNPSRRALLGAAVGLPLLPLDGGGRVGVDCDIGKGAFEAEPGSTLTPTLPSPIEGEGTWSRALAEPEAAEAEMEAFQRRTAGAPWEEQEAVERGMEERLDLLEPALLRLVRMPAPDLPALATKIALVAHYHVGEMTGGEGCLALLERDARRLAGGADRRSN
jgi:hypothetical protein